MIPKFHWLLQHLCNCFCLERKHRIPMASKTWYSDKQPSESDDEEGPTPCWKWAVRALVAFIVVGGTIFVIVRRDITRAVLEWFFTWLGENRWIGPIALFVIFAVA